MINSAVVRGENLRFSESGVKQILRDLLIPWWNAYSFFVTYANVDGWQPRGGDAKGQRAEGSCHQGSSPTSFHHSTIPTPSSPSLMDRWILSRLDRLAGDVVAALDAYDLQLAVRPLVQFIDDLTNWYIRRSRDRFWDSDNSLDASTTAAFDTLYTALEVLTRAVAPLLPLTTEEIWRGLTGGRSVHLEDWPDAATLPADHALVAGMDRAPVS